MRDSSQLYPKRCRVRHRLRGGNVRDRDIACHRYLCFTLRARELGRRRHVEIILDVVNSMMTDGAEDMVHVNCNPQRRQRMEYSSRRWSCLE